MKRNTRTAALVVAAALLCGGGGYLAGRSHTPDPCAAARAQHGADVAAYKAGAAASDTYAMTEGLTQRRVTAYTVVGNAQCFTPQETAQWQADLSLLDRP